MIARTLLQDEHGPGRSPGKFASSVKKVEDLLNPRLGIRDLRGGLMQIFRDLASNTASPSAFLIRSMTQVIPAKTQTDCGEGARQSGACGFIGTRAATPRWGLHPSGLSLRIVGLSLVVFLAGCSSPSGSREVRTETDTRQDLQQSDTRGRDNLRTDLPEDLTVPPMPLCPQAPPKCNQDRGEEGPVEGIITEIQAGGFRMYDLDTWDEAGRIVDKIAEHGSATPVTLDLVLQDLDRTAQKITRLEETACFHTGFSWNVEDSTVMSWYPQGITGAAAAGPDGTWNGRNVVVVSWYHRPEDDPDTDRNKGARIAIVDLSDMNNIRYRLALLVEPYWNEGKADFKPVEIHAGGLGWYGNYLYVADTSNGFRVFDVRRLLRFEPGDQDALGFSSEETGYQAFGYRYALPQVSTYRLTEESCCARFSFASIDLSTQPPSLLSGEYSEDSIAGRVHAWPLNPETGKLVTIRDMAISSWAAFPGVRKMQGALTRDRHLFVSSSQDLGVFYEAPIGSMLESHPWSYFPEDLHFSASSDNLWCLTEMPGYRYVFAAKATDLRSGCDD